MPKFLRISPLTHGMDRIQPVSCRFLAMTSFLWLVMAGLRPVQAGDSASLEARWRREYPIAAAAWESSARNFLAEGTYLSQTLAKTKVTTNSLTIAASGDKRLIIRDDVRISKPNSPEADSRSGVECETADYAFKLVRPTKSDPFVIDSYQEYESRDESQFQRLWKHLARSATVLFETSVLQRVQNPTFRLKSIESVATDGDQHVRIQYAYESNVAREEGWVVFDPDKNWAIRKYEVEVNNKKGNQPVKFEGTIDYQQVDPTHFFPHHHESFARVPKPDVFEHKVVVLNRVKLGDIPDDMFKMTKYGLPDVPLRAKPRSSVFTARNPIFWVTLIASLTSFGLLWWLRRRSNKAVPALDRSPEPGAETRP